MRFSIFDFLFFCNDDNRKHEGCNECEHGQEVHELHQYNICLIIATTLQSQLSNLWASQFKQRCSTSYIKIGNPTPLKKTNDLHVLYNSLFMDIQIPNIIKEVEVPLTQNLINSRIIQVLNSNLQMEDQNTPKVTKVDQIQNQIFSILNPTKMALIVPKLSEDTKIEDIQKYSLMNFYSEVYVQFIGQISSMVHQLPSSPKEYQAKVVDVMEKTFDIVGDNTGITTKISYLLKMLQNKNLPVKTHMRVLIQTTLLHVNKVLTDTKFQIGTDTLCQVLLNPKCVKFQQTDPKTLLKFNQSVIKQKLTQIQQKGLPDVTKMSKDIVQNVLKEQLRKSFVRPDSRIPFTHWATLTPQDMRLNPTQLTLNRFYIQRSKFKEALSKQYQQMKKIQQEGPPNYYSSTTS